jgi:protease IV
LMLFVNTPGGGVYESDELYLKIKEYQEYTERPVYAYFASQATSGGYYVSSSADKIIANRNCWTGSIGVTIGTLYDISGLLQKYGIKTETITSGANKAMGDITVPMSDQQRNIFQSLVDESYDQFVSVVAQGRNLDTDYVKTIADGRIYTAKQAESNKLIDDIVGTYDEAVEEMIYDCGLVGCDVYEFRYQPQQSLFSGFVESVDKFTEALSGNSDINAITDFLNDSNQLPLQYMCEEIK